MSMLADLPRQGPPIGFRHPVLGLDELVRRHSRLERGQQFGVFSRADRLHLGAGLKKVGRVHEA